MPNNEVLTVVDSPDSTSYRTGWRPIIFILRLQILSVTLNPKYRV